jgi:hypothetical protein
VLIFLSTYTQKTQISSSRKQQLSIIFMLYVMILFNVFYNFSDKWLKTSSGLPSTAGTTASVAFIRTGNIYIGHVGYQQHENDKFWVAEPLTQDHKPECKPELPE